jgi:hypothetical protein
VKRRLITGSLVATFAISAFGATVSAGPSQVPCVRNDWDKANVAGPSNPNASPDGLAHALANESKVWLRCEHTHPIRTETSTSQLVRDVVREVVREVVRVSAL